MKMNQALGFRSIENGFLFFTVLGIQGRLMETPVTPRTIGKKQKKKITRSLQFYISYQAGCNVYKTEKGEGFLFRFESWVLFAPPRLVYRAHAFYHP